MTDNKQGNQDSPHLVGASLYERVAAEVNDIMLVSLGEPSVQEIVDKLNVTSRDSRVREFINGDGEMHIQLLITQAVKDFYKEITEFVIKAHVQSAMRDDGIGDTGGHNE